MKHYYLFILISIFCLFGCSESEEYDTTTRKTDNENLLFFPERNLEKCTKSTNISNFDILEKMEIVFLDIEKKIIFFRNSSDTNQVYYSNCVIDSSFYATLTDEEHQDIVYIGSFHPTDLKKLKLTFISIFSLNEQTNKYQNTFNTYYFVEKSFIDIQIVNNLINNSNALLLSNYQGSGNFLEINLIAKNKNKIMDITPEIPPLSQGEYLIDSSRVLLMEGLMVWEIVQSNEKPSLELKKMDSLPLVDFRDGDKIIKFRKSGSRIITDSKIYVCNWTGVIHLQIDEPNNELMINFDPQYFKRKFNQLIPLKAGYTSIELIDADFNFVINNIKIYIN